MTNTMTNEIRVRNKPTHPLLSSESNGVKQSSKKKDNDENSRRKPQARTQRRHALLLLICAGSFFSLICKYDQYFQDVSKYDGSVETNPFVSNNATECRYDGHCPVGMTCAVSPKKHLQYHSLPGICEEVPIIINKETKPNPTCVEACKLELQLDEQYFQDSWPEIVDQHATAPRGRPGGCALTYRRVPDKTEARANMEREWQEADRKGEPHQLTPSFQKWNKTRFRHIIRVDPVLDHDVQRDDDDRWTAYCTAPCMTDQDCSIDLQDDQIEVSHPAFICRDGACQRNSVFWEEEEETAPDLVDGRHPSRPVLVTGATEDYFDGLQNLLASARYWAPNHKFVVYNLGDLSERQQKAVRDQSNVLALEWPDGAPETYPDHIRVGRRYGWKAVIVKETLDKYGMIAWMDAGNTLTGPLDPIEYIVKRQGIFLVKGQDRNMAYTSHPLMYQWFNVSKDTYKTGPAYAGGLHAYLKPSRYVDTVVKSTFGCSLAKDCINPPGSGLGNHRYDQTSLSIAAYHPKVRAPHYTEYVAAFQYQVPGLPFQPSFRFVWTARQTCQDYKNIQTTYQEEELKTK